MRKYFDEIVSRTNKTLCMSLNRLKWKKKREAAPKSLANDSQTGSEDKTYFFDLVQCSDIKNLIGHFL